MTRDGSAEVIRRLLAAQGRLSRLTLLWGLFCQTLNEIGIPVDRGFLTLRQLHPQIAARSLYWDSLSRGAVEVTRGYEVVRSDAYFASPMFLVFEKLETLHERLDRPDGELRFSIYRELKQQGFVDYLALPLRFSGRRVHAMTLATKAAAGFSTAQVGSIEACLPALVAVLELHHQRQTAQTVLATYVGQRTGARVWSGEIHRGQGEELHAIFFLCDLRGFTELSANQPLPQTIATLNAYFDAIGGAVEAAGGEILKFIGDALLAIFPCKRKAPAIAAAATSAWQATERGLTALAQLNEQRAAARQPKLRVGIALHVGDALYGNIGTSTRLDFTVIGPAVNLVARLGTLAGQIKETVLISSDLAPHLQHPLRSVGKHALKGLPAPVEVFAPVTATTAGAPS